ncbi:hypothetical protein CDAR_224851 [Caerostris darwini]|uniref:Uncharacterized protein n=1 Tax=Caerostris darwini TaxID=1538125 RepID=A0AAV4N9M8_9ARAC|nr:hypothetical protein CDAR_224851 [Caerostris darwini]
MSWLNLLVLQVETPITKQHIPPEIRHVLGTSHMQASFLMEPRQFRPTTRESDSKRSIVCDDPTRGGLMRIKYEKGSATRFNITLSRGKRTRWVFFPSGI